MSGRKHYTLTLGPDEDGLFEYVEARKAQGVSYDHTLRQALRCLRRFEEGELIEPPRGSAAGPPEVVLSAGQVADLVQRIVSRLSLTGVGVTQAEEEVEGAVTAWSEGLAGGLLDLANASPEARLGD
jgi:hypothetical protein